MTTTTKNEITNDVLAADDDFMADLEAELNMESAEHGVDEVTASDWDAELEAELASVEASEQEADAEPEPEKKATAKKPAKKKAAEKKATDTESEEVAKPEKQKRASVSGMPPSDALQKVLGGKVYEYCVTTQEQIAMSDADRKEAVDSFLTGDLDKLAKKVKEKAVNVFQNVAGQSKLSIFTEMALDLLKEKQEFAIGDLKQAYLNRPYSPGTASAQSSQMMMLLPALNIAKREGNKLVLVEDSPLFETLTA